MPTRAACSTPRQVGQPARRSRTTLRLLRTAATIVLAAASALWALPQPLGGSAGYVIVSGASMEPRLHNGDFVVARSQPSYRVGDVIAYRISEGQPGAGVLVIHRVIAGSAASGYITQGDNTTGADPWRPKPPDIVGRMQLSVPRAGLALALMRTPLGIATIIAIVTFMVVAATAKPKRTTGEENRHPD